MVNASEMFVGINIELCESGAFLRVIFDRGGGAVEPLEVLSISIVVNDSKIVVEDMEFLWLVYD